MIIQGCSMARQEYRRLLCVHSVVETESFRRDRMQRLASMQRREAMQAAKLAVRSYARDPSAANAADVETAWQRLRQLDGVARWRDPAERQSLEAATKSRSSGPLSV